MMLVVAAVAFFVANSLPVTLLIAMVEGRTLRSTWSESYLWSFPYYIIGSAIAAAYNAVNNLVGWQTSMLLLPVVYLIYRSYRLYLDRLDDGKQHAEEMAALHLRTIEALALAIEAKDTTTHDHLQRVQIYALEVARELGLGDQEIEAVRAASLLHDIGKLAVPEHIISKPGKLTPEEFEKMKIHPVVGAELLERVQFPYPVAPIVRSHHERWNGSGYPDGLSGETIPIGARILAAVDCLDALASDRQYRRALPLDEAMAKVVSESGTSFDPKVVDILKRRYIEFEQMARSKSAEKAMPKLSTDVKVERGAAPAAGFEETKQTPTHSNGTARSTMPFLASIAAAREEVQALFELSQNLGSSLSLDETLSVLAVRLKKMMPYDAMTIWVIREEILRPDYVTGENARLFSSLAIPVGQGLSGWVAENKKPIINGNPSVEPGYLNDPSKFSTLRSALAVPLEGANGVVGVMALYSAEKDAFSKDHLRILLAISTKVSVSMENAMKYKQAETSATTDYLTGLPNARSLFEHLENELTRCRRLGLPLAVLVCDLDGFKQINDSYGHLEGNKVLKSVAIKLKEHCRDYDYVARMGGDEFVMVLPGVRMSGGNSKAATLSAIATEAGMEIIPGSTLSLSVGLANFPDDGADADQLLAEADRRMYAAKSERYTRRPNVDMPDWPAAKPWMPTSIQ